MNSSNREEEKDWSKISLFIIIIIILIIFLCIIPIFLAKKKLQFEIQDEWPSLLGGNFGLLLGITEIIKTVYFNGKEKFNKDSLFICLCCILPLVPLIFYIIYEACLKKTQEYLKHYTNYSAVVIILLSFYFWIIYLYRCREVIIEIKTDEYLFFIKMFKSMLGAVLVCFSADIIINSLLEQDSITKSIYQVVNIFVNAMYPFADMYTYVRSKLDKYMEDNNNPIKIKSHTD